MISGLDLMDLLFQRDLEGVKLAGHPGNPRKVKPQGSKNQNAQSNQSQHARTWLDGNDDRPSALTMDPLDVQHPGAPRTRRRDPIPLNQGTPDDLALEPELNFPAVLQAQPDHCRGHRLDNVVAIESCSQVPALQESVGKDEAKENQGTCRSA